jgi:hypothetical protein
MFASFAGFSGTTNQTIGPGMIEPVRDSGDLLALEEEPPPPPPPPPIEEAPPPPIEETQSPSAEEQPIFDESSSSEGPSRSGSGTNRQALSKEEEATEKALRYKNLPIVSISDEERRYNCRLYDKKFVTFHDQVYFIRDCKSYVLSSEDSSKLSRAGVKVREILGRELASLKEGGDYSTQKTEQIRCADFNQNYVTYNLKIYWVETCLLREFPDNASMQDHRWKNKFFKKPVLVLEEYQFKQFKFGTVFKSILDSDVGAEPDEYKRLSIEEACRNLSRYVAYIDNIYKITPSKSGKGCSKEKIDSAEMSRKMNFSNLHEITPGRFLSIPTTVSD